MKCVTKGNQRKKNYSMSLSQADLTLRILLTLEFRVTCETFTLEISKPFTYKKKLSQSFTEFINNWFLNYVIPDNFISQDFSHPGALLVITALHGGSCSEIQAISIFALVNLNHDINFPMETSF